ncbi:MAG: hemerythrin family protein [Alphaproteobacteria bacterium]|nr:hemerythrin family protein [Alphaproteobacteria bacterium]
MRIDTIDGEHRVMTGMVLDMMKAGDVVTRIDVLRALHDYADEHFCGEETLIEYHGLPGLDIQREQHRKFRAILVSYIDQVQAGERLSVAGIRQFILSWWINHINDVDAVSFAPSALAATVFLSADSWEDYAPFIRATGIDQIDADHRSISNLIIRMKEMLHQEASKEEAVALFDEILAFARSHFKYEEAILADSGAPLGKLHMDSHAHFLVMVENFRGDILFDRLSLSENIRKRLLEWWANHINQFDYDAFGCQELTS